MSASRARTLAGKVGAEIFVGPLDYGVSITAWTPVGVMWRASTCHVIAAHSHTDRASAWRALVEDMALGTDPCEDPDCDMCHPDQESA